MSELPVSFLTLRGEEAGASHISNLEQSACDELLEARFIADFVDEGLRAAVDYAVADHVKSEDWAILFGQMLVGGEHVRRVDVGKVAEEEVGGWLGDGEFCCGAGAGAVGGGHG